ncbi:VOC family protein [Actinoplanes sp. NPDC051470]|uniref:VOC family protein n=1 Tax=unclassified Actinoplanes TaxID=2626549 RepID=UPI0034185A34
MAWNLFACSPVTDLAKASAWYERFVGKPSDFSPNDHEAVWDLAERASIYIELLPEHAGHGKLTLFVDELDTVVAGISGRGLEPESQETYDNGVRKLIYRDPDGNEVGLGGMPAGD